MQKKLLAVGDVVAPAGLNYLRAKLPKLRRELQVDFCVVQQGDVLDDGKP